jgi:hypothetical protein
MTRRSAPRATGARSDRRGPSVPVTLRAFAGFAAALAGASGPAVLGMAQLLSSPAPGLRAGLAAGSLARLTAPALASALLQPDAPILTALLLIGLAAAVLAGAAARGTRRPAQLATASETRPDHAEATPPPPSGPHPATDPRPARRYHDDARSAGEPTSEAPPVPGRRGDQRLAGWAAGPASRAACPVGAAVAVGSITGTVARAAAGGRWWTVRSTGARLRDGVPYRVVARDGDVLIIAPG